jgi:adenylate kinase family enzyme
MPLFLITGLPAAGKSTVCVELKARGYEAYDGDNDHLSRWFDSKGREVEQERTLEFFRTHTCDLPRQTVETLAAKAKEAPIFICNNPQNEIELHDLFDKIFALVIDVDTMKDRLASRTTNDWGKLPYELQVTLDDVQPRHDMYGKFGYIKIDGTQPTNNIVDQILEKIAT